MKIKYLALALLPLLSNAAQAAPGEESFVALSDTSPAAIQTHSGLSLKATQNMADRCSDFTTNGWGFKAPRNFLKWLDVFTDPAIYLEYAGRGLDPQTYVRSLSSLLDPGTPRNYLEWTNPDIYNQWTQASTQPEFFSAVNSILSDQSRITRWAKLPLDERAWNLVGTALNPETWVKWLYAPADPKTQALFAKAVNPETLQRWLEALGDPNNTPWFNPPPTTYSAQPAILSTPVVKPATTNISL